MHLSRYHLLSNTALYPATSNLGALTNANVTAFFRSTIRHKKSRYGGTLAQFCR